MIRPLLFGERWRLLDRIAAGQSSVGATVLAHARDPGSTAASASSAEDEIAQVLALYLAGARPERAAQGFAAQLSRLMAAGWKPCDVLDAEADLVDRLTADAPDTPDGDDWTTIEIVSEQLTTAAPAAVLRALEQNLLDRMASADGDGSRSLTDHPPVAAWGDRGLTAPPPAPPSRTTAEESQRVGADAVASSPDIAHGGPHAPAAANTNVTGPTSARTRGHAYETTPLAEIHTATERPTPATADRGDQRRVRAGMAEHQSTKAWIAQDQADAPPPAAPDFGPTIASHVLGPVVSRTVEPAAVPIHRHIYRAGHAAAGSTVVHDDPVAPRTAQAAQPSPAGTDARELADQLAAMLDDEADLRGLRR
ncbi:hypothetical protein MAGR_40080 [Mycolicibacterium agri]|uniref:Uncharacterized protein n=1 Tax=Mycolicibacterium agri TaxID=36811 RepID=A0A7I9W588_MYCAG|nr:hypothetical protein MAGR_40080 [Mycolicibacterium agri]